MAMKVATLERLGEFLAECKALFASQAEVTDNDSDIETHVLNVDYTQIEFDTSDIVV